MTPTWKKMPRSSRTRARRHRSIRTTAPSTAGSTWRPTQANQLPLQVQGAPSTAWRRRFSWGPHHHPPPPHPPIQAPNSLKQQRSNNRKPNNGEKTNVSTQQTLFLAVMLFELFFTLRQGAGSPRGLRAWAIFPEQALPGSCPHMDQPCARPAAMSPAWMYCTLPVLRLFGFGGLGRVFVCFLRRELQTDYFLRLFIQSTGLWIFEMLAKHGLSCIG